MALLGDAAAPAAGDVGNTDSVSRAAELMKPGCDARPDESPLSETTSRNGGYNISEISLLMAWVGCVVISHTLPKCQQDDLNMDNPHV